MRAPPAWLRRAERRGSNDCVVSCDPSHVYHHLSCPASSGASSNPWSFQDGRRLGLLDRPVKPGDDSLEFGTAPGAPLPTLLTSEPEHVQHQGVALLLELRRVDESPLRDRARP